MRGRIGGRIGAGSPPSMNAASGMWGIAELYAAKTGYFGSDPWTGAMPWPATTVAISWPTGGYYDPPIDWVDATANGSATFSANVTTSVADFAFSYYWERSTNSGATWSVVSGSSGSTTAAWGGYGGGEATVTLSLTGQTVSNDEDRYRLVVNAGLKTVFGPTGTLRFDTVTLGAGGGLTRNYNNYLMSLTVAAGTNFAYYTNGTFLGVKYDGGYAPASLAMQRSDDGGTTWQEVTNLDSIDAFGAYKNYTASASDNGAKWRGAFQFLGQTYYGPVATLTVT